MKRLKAKENVWLVEPQEISSGSSKNEKTDTLLQRGGVIDINVIKNLPGTNGEEDYIKWRTLPNGMKMYGNMSEDEWYELVEDIRNNGFNPDFPIFIQVWKDGKKTIGEGNHRLRAALEAGIEHVPVFICYYGNAERNYKF